MFHVYETIYILLPYTILVPKYMEFLVMSFMNSKSVEQLKLNSVRLFWKLLAFMCLLGTSETFLCSTFALQLKTVLLLYVLQLLMLSAGTLMSLEIIMFPWNTFYCEHDTFMLSIYLIVCVQQSILFFFSFSYFMYVCRYLDIFQKKNKNNIYFKDTFSERLTVQIH
jgi:hypothetical protein